ncbi:hypothetical protein ACYCVF_32120 [Bradyrhizobium sp. 1.29L]
MQIRIDDLRVNAFLRRPQIERLAEQPLAQEPAASSIGAGRRFPDHGLDRFWSSRLKQGFQDQQVKSFIFEGERQMAFEAGRRRVARRVNVPTVLLIFLMARPDGG